MACLGVQIGSSAGRRVSVSGGISEDIQCRFRHSLLEFTDERQKRCRRVAVCLAQLGKSESYGASVVTSLPLALSEVKNTNGRKKPANPPQVDNLIKRSVTEIVKNISEAPFLVHVYSKSDDSDAEKQSINDSQLKLEIERATTESWPFIRQRWEGENSASPDSVILVEELSSEEEALLDTEKEEIASFNTAVCSRNQRIPPSSTKVWDWWCKAEGLIALPATFSRLAEFSVALDSQLISAWPRLNVLGRVLSFISTGCGYNDTILVRMIHLCKNPYHWIGLIN